MSDPDHNSLPFTNAIGVFDSGVGGLSVLRAIRAALPVENLVYVADSGFAPYGDKSESFITERTLTIGNWLASSGVKAITVACNTATVVAIRRLREQTHLPVVAIEPAIKPATNATQSGVVGVLATTQTLQSESVARLSQEYGAGKQILLQPCPGWVEAVERADLQSPQTVSLIRQVVEPLLRQGADTLVLGCTHYPFLREVLQRTVGNSVSLIDPADAVATELARRIGHTGHTDASYLGTTEFFTSGDLVHVQKVVSLLWGEPAIVKPMPC